MNPFPCRFSLFVILFCTVIFTGCGRECENAAETGGAVKTGGTAETGKTQRSRCEEMQKTEKEEADGEMDARRGGGKMEIVENALFLCYSGETFIGTETRLTVRSAREIEVQDTSELKMNRYGNEVFATVRHTERLKPAGNLKEFCTTLAMGGAPMTYVGKMKDAAEENEGKAQLAVEVSTQGMKQAQTLDFTLSEERPKVCGGYALETELLLNPIKNGEKREFFRINPTMIRWEHLRAECVGIENVTLPGGASFPMLRVETKANLLENGTETPTQEETLWCDGEGRVWKRVSPLMNLASWRSSAAELEACEKSGKFPGAPQDSTKKKGNVNPESSGNLLDFAENQNVSVTFGPHAAAEMEKPENAGSTPAEKLANAQEAVYQISALNSEDAERTRLRGLFTSSEFQKVEELDDYTVRITVRNSNQAAFSDVKSSEVTADDTQAGPLIQSDAPAIQTLAGSVIPGEISNLKVAEALENFVFRFIRNKNYARGFVTALEVAENPSGDCTEHAVLLAAAARARKIPARIAQGLIFEKKSGKMSWHVWNELFIDGAWRPFDGTLGTGNVAPNHVRINSGSFSSTTLAATLLPAAQLIGKIEITVEEIR